MWTTRKPSLDEETLAEVERKKASMIRNRRKGNFISNDDDDDKVDAPFPRWSHWETLAFYWTVSLETPRKTRKKRAFVSDQVRVPACSVEHLATTDKGFSVWESSSVREQCRIDYRTPTGIPGGGGSESRAGTRLIRKGLVPARRNIERRKQPLLDKPIKLDLLSNKTGFSSLPVWVKCHYRQWRVEQGQTAVLPTGSCVRISHLFAVHCLPTRASTKTYRFRPGNGEHKKAQARAQLLLPLPQPLLVKRKSFAGCFCFYSGDWWTAQKSKSYR
jgi:hypothetical protein